ncbi:uncharacterized protein, partial [Triticum aestivum]|uniref:uncharacterized protein n=1 Tax=Triticum aestivum TaxID=4565 RepID=UPI001D018F40
RWCAAGDASSPLSLARIVFEIAGSAHLWSCRREYVRLWWDPASMRGHVWLDASAPGAPGPSAAGARGGWCSWTTTPCCPRTTWWCAREVRLEGDGVRRGLVGEPLGQHLFQPRPLAAVLARTLDVCIERYPRLYGSDDRLHACITELGVPLSREYEFHHVCLGVHIFDRQTLIGALDCLRKCQLKAKFS